jgi:hypothetical protein
MSATEEHGMADGGWRCAANGVARCARVDACSSVGLSRLPRRACAASCLARDVLLKFLARLGNCLIAGCRCLAFRSVWVL